MAARLFLGLSVVIWLPYGLFCFFQPGFLTEAAGLGLGSTTASTEVRAMYGGLQAGIGVLALAALFRPGLVRPALLAIAFLTGGLALGRIGGALLDGSTSGYTLGAIGFELFCVVTASLLQSRVAPEAATA